MLCSGIEPGYPVVGAGRSAELSYCRYHLIWFVHVQSHLVSFAEILHFAG